MVLPPIAVVWFAFMSGTPEGQLDESESARSSATEVEDEPAEVGVGADVSGAEAAVPGRSQWALLVGMPISVRTRAGLRAEGVMIGEERGTLLLEDSEGRVIPVPVAEIERVHLVKREVPPPPPPPPPPPAALPPSVASPHLAKESETLRMGESEMVADAEVLYRKGRAMATVGKIVLGVFTIPLLIGGGTWAAVDDQSVPGSLVLLGCSAGSAAVAIPLVVVGGNRRRRAKRVLDRQSATGLGVQAGALVLSF